MANLKNRLIHVTVGYDELHDSPIAVDDENGLLDFLCDSVGVLHDWKGNWLTDEQALYILETSGVGSLYGMRTGLYPVDGKSISTKSELAD